MLYPYWFNQELFLYFLIPRSVIVLSLMVWVRERLWVMRMKLRTNTIKRQIRAIAIVLAGSSGVSVPLLWHTSVLASPSGSQVQDVVDHLVGQMDTAVQAALDAKKVPVRMTTCKVKVSGVPQGSSKIVYLYQEQALVNRLNLPYRQRVLGVSLVDGKDVVESKAFKLVQPEPWAGWCSKAEDDRVIPYEAIKDARCSVFLKPYLGLYVGETQPGGCPTNLRGAKTITNFIILRRDGMDTHDRGFDQQGKQVWGAEGEAYEFRWLLGFPKK